MTTKKKSILAGGMAALAIASMVAGGTMANWSDKANIGGATLTAGNLDIEAGKEAKWVDVSTDVDKALKPIDLKSFRTVPGDVLEGRYPFSVALEGDNMKAQMRITLPEQSTGDLLNDSHGVTLNYAIHKTSDGTTPNGKALAQGKITEEETGVNLELTPEDVGRVALEEGDAANYVVVVKATFDKETSNQERVKATASLEEIQADLTQVRPLSD